jgi:hypothetical protein
MKEAGGLTMRTAFLLASVALAASGLAAPVPVSAVCDNKPYVIFYEDANYGGDSQLRACYPTKIDNLGDIAAPAGCQAGLFPRGDFNDCISSFRVLQTNCHYYFAQYVNEGYDNLMPSPLSGWGSRSGNYGSYNDSLTSFKWSYRNTCQEPL